MKEFTGSNMHHDGNSLALKAKINSDGTASFSINPSRGGEVVKLDAATVSELCAQLRAASAAPKAKKSK